MMRSVSQQARMYYGSRTVDRSTSGQLADANAYAPGECCVCNHQVAALFCVKSRHGCYLESITSYRKSDSCNQCVFTWRTFPSNFISIRYEAMEP